MDKSAESPRFSGESVASWFDEKTMEWKEIPKGGTHANPELTVRLTTQLPSMNGPINEVEPGKPIPIYRNYEVAPPLEDLNLVDLAAKLNPDQNEFIRRTIIELLSIGLK